ncbi:MAG: TolC family protein [Planctomycetota bacterium]|nr:TolC family protein [Planctomycetota bacterium]
MNDHLTWGGFARFALCAFTFFVSGCAVDQKTEVATARKWIDGGKPGDARIEPGAVVSLTDALRLANQNEERLSIQGETYLQALIAKDRGFAAFQPTANVGASYSLSSQTTAFFGPTSHNFSAPASGQINLFNGFRDYHNLKAVDFTIEQQKQLVLDLQQTVLLEVIQTYYQVLTSEQSVEVFTNSIQVQQARVRNIQAQARVGTARPLDVAQAQAQLSQTQVSLNQSRADVSNGRATLAFLIDAPIQENPLRDDYDPPTDSHPLDQWELTAEDGRQDLKAAQASVNAARQQVEIAFGQYYPTLSANLNYSLYTDPLGGAGLWNGLLNLNLPIFTGGVIHANVRTAWSQFRQQSLTQRQLKRSIDETVEQAYTNLDLAHRQLAELQIEVRAARDALYLADQTYKAGRGILLDVLTAQNTLLTTQLQLTTEEFNQKTAYLNMLRTVGKLNLTIAQSTTRPSQQALRELATQPATAPSPQP